ncbi:MAG TPA: Ig-like domain-containing protein [Chitinophagales bacterium]|nr:Ig-like domain-containing protein [Chitinophagales bacterium]
MMRLLKGSRLAILAIVLGSSLPVLAQSYDAAPDFYVINEDVTDVIFDVTANDLNTTGVTDIYLNIAVAPANGSVFVDDVNDLLIYTPNPDFFGTDNFQYTGCANTDPDICGTTSVIITVNPVDDKPIAIDDAVTTFVNTPINLEPLLNDIDLDDEGLEMEILDDANFGATTIVGGEFVFYEPFTDTYGEDCFTYRACKIGSDVYCDTATVCVDVQSVNFNAPSAVNDTAELILGDTIDIFVLLNDFDGDGDGLLITGLLTDGISGIATISGDHVNYIPVDLGSEEFGYIVCDDNVPPLCDTAYVLVRALEPEVEDGELHVINSFSPNGDGDFDVVTVDWPDNNIRYGVKIYDRWNNLIYENAASADQGPLWDGNSNVEFISSTGQAPDGTYFYVLRVDGLLDPIVGFIVLKR